MLRTAAEYPNPGSTAFLAPSGEEVRIIQRNADGTVLVAVTRLQRAPASASDTRTVEADTLHPTSEDATRSRPRASGGRPRQRRAGQ